MASRHSWSFLASILLLIAGGIAARDAAAGTIRNADERLLVSGHITDEDARYVARELRENPKIDTVVFEQCRGGTVSAAFMFADLIKLRRLNAVAVGACSSACALAFLAGEHRFFGDGSRLSWVGLHAARKPDGSGPSSNALNRQVMAALKSFTSGKLSSELIELISKSWSARSGVFFVRVERESIKRDEVWHCDGQQGRDGRRCQRLGNYDALSQGIITER